MNNAKKFLKVSTALGVIFTCGTILSTTINNSFKNVSAASTAIESKQYTEADFAGETLESDDCLVASITQATKTTTSNSFTVTFRSQTLTGLSNVKSNYVIKVDDENFTGKEDTPAVEGHDRYNEDELPIFNGTLLYILSAGSGDNLFIPSTFVRTGKYVIDVTTIESGAISKDGDPAFTAGQNIWEKANGAIKNVYIPESITTCKTGAFKDVPTDVKFHFQGESVPTGFENDWATPITDAQIDFNAEFGKRDISQVATKLVDLPDDLNRPIDYILGYRANEDYSSEDYNKPLVVEYDIHTFEDETIKSTRTVFEELPIQNTNNPYDSVGKTFDSHTVELTISVGDNELVDDKSIVFHNIYRAYRPNANKKLTIDLTKPLYVKALKSYSEAQPLSNLVNLKPTRISKFMGYSVFALTMDLNFDIVSEQFPDPHSLYLDVKTPIYNQNLSKIKEGITSIRYSIITLYNTNYYFEYVGKDGQPKSILTHVEAAIDNQVLSSKKGNVVSLLIKDSEIAPDFDASKVTKFEIRDLFIQMDLTTISDSGSVSKLAKSEISYRFGSVEIYNKELKTLPATFDCNLFLIIFYVSYIVLYVGAAYALFRVLKEKFKNDEFRRVNGKKFFKTAALGFGGLAVVLAAVLSILGRTTVFFNSIVVFNPTDPFVIILSIFAAIFIGYFIVNIVKLVKAELERKQSIRLKLNEDKTEDGTN